MDEKRSAERVPLDLSLQCRILEPTAETPAPIEMIAQNINSQGVKLKCSVWENVGVCPFCSAVMKDETLIRQDYHFQIFKNGLKEGRWLEVLGLDNLAGLISEKKVLGKIMWASIKNETNQVEIGLKFEKELPDFSAQEISLKNAEAETLFQGSKAPDLTGGQGLKDLNAELQKQMNEVDALILADKKRKGPEELSKIFAKRKKFLIVDDDKLESAYLFSLAKKMDFSGQQTSGRAEALKTISSARPRVIFLNPSLNGKLDLKLLSEIRDISPEFVIALLIEKHCQKDILDDPAVRSANAIFVKPLDLLRVYELLKGID